MAHPCRPTSLLRALGLALALGIGVELAQAAGQFIVVQSTTSTQIGRAHV